VGYGTVAIDIGIWQTPAPGRFCVGSIERCKNALHLFFAFQNFLESPEALADFQLHPAALHCDVLDPLEDRLRPVPDYAYIIPASLRPVLLRCIYFIDFWIGVVREYFFCGSLEHGPEHAPRLIDGLPPRAK